MSAPRPPSSTASARRVTLFRTAVIPISPNGLFSSSPALHLHIALVNLLTLLSAGCVPSSLHLTLFHGTNSLKLSRLVARLPPQSIPRFSLSSPQYVVSIAQLFRIFPQPM